MEFNWDYTQSPDEEGYYITCPECGFKGMWYDFRTDVVSEWHVFKLHISSELHEYLRETYPDYQERSLGRYENRLCHVCPECGTRI